MSSHLRVHISAIPVSLTAGLFMSVACFLFFSSSNLDPSHILNNDSCELCFTRRLQTEADLFPFQVVILIEQKPLLLLTPLSIFLYDLCFLTRLKRSLRYYLLFCKKKGFKILLFLFYFLICLELIFMYGVRQESIFIYG